MHFDIAIAGGGPAGLSAAYSAASAGASVLLVEQGSEIGSPTRTSGGSFARELLDLDIPHTYLHSIMRIRFVSPHRSAVFEYPDPIFCVMDVRGVYQHLASVAARAGAKIWLASKALNLIREKERTVGISVETRTKKNVDIRSDVVIDATGYRGALADAAGIRPRIRRFGVGAEYDMFAPHCDQDEAVLVVGRQFAPSGYGWVCPWGNDRVRVGVGVIHPDDASDPVTLLEPFVEAVSNIGVNLSGAQPIEYHFGLIPSDMAEHFVGEGLVAVGDAAGHASTLVGEGIRWAIKAGRLAGKCAARAAREGDTSEDSLGQFQAEWLRKYGRDLRIANMINRRISTWDDRKWDERTELLSLFSAEEFATALQTDFSFSWALGLAWAHPRLVRFGLDKVFQRLGILPG
jgi:digeranylgeranylglycerophospholipid reductase